MCGLCVVKRVSLYSLIFGVYMMQISIVIAGGTHEIQYPVEWDQFEPSAIDIRPLVLDAPAGKHGHILAKGDKLFFADGNPAKFWGVGLTFSNKLPYKFPPEKSIADKIVDKLARLGFNHVRFVGLDNSARKPLNDWIKTGILSSPELDELGYFIYKLKQAGIYYSFSIHNNSPVLMDDAISEYANKNASRKLWRYKNIRLYNEVAIKRTEDWYRAFYSWKNPYTNLTLAEDPANIYVSAVNEDSIFEAYFTNFKYLDDFSLQLLNKEFLGYLVKKYGAVELAESTWVKSGDEKKCRPLIERGGAKFSASENCAYRKRDIIDFLINVEVKYYGRIKATLRDIGYKGLFTGTNNWYGYGNLYANSQVGDYIETHGYLDHPRSKKFPVAAEGFVGKSYVKRQKTYKKSIEQEHSYLLSKTFRSSLIDKPVIVSEWGHSAWSPYSYEGIGLIASYSAFQGYQAIGFHTYFNHPHPDPEESLARQGLTITGNPVMQSLLPSFAVAFLRGDITTPENSHIKTCAKTYDDFLNIVESNQLKKNVGTCGFSSLEGYVTKIRTEFINNSVKKIKANYDLGGNRYTTSTSQIVWNGVKNDDDYFIVNTPRFKIAMTPEARYLDKNDDFSVEFMDHGIVTILSLNNKTISELDRVLITLAQSFSNTDMGTFNLGGISWVRDIGKSPVIFKFPKVKISINVSNKDMQEIALCALSPEGEIKRLNNLVIKKEGAVSTVLLDATDTPSPWFLLGTNINDVCSANSKSPPVRVN